MNSDATIADEAFPVTHTPFGDQVERYIPIVRNIVEHFRPRLPSHVDLGELFSIGVTGLMSALRNYTEERAPTFGGYAVRRIRGAILDELRKADTRSRRARMKARRIAEATNRLEQKFGRPATDLEIRRELGLNERVFARWRLAATQLNFVSLDSTPSVDEEDGPKLHDSIADDSASLAPASMERTEMCALLAEGIKALPEKQQKIIALYYHEGMRFAEIAGAFGVSESRICQIHGQAVKALRSKFLNQAA